MTPVTQYTQTNAKTQTNNETMSPTVPTTPPNEINDVKQTRTQAIPQTKTTVQRLDKTVAKTHNATNETKTEPLAIPTKLTTLIKLATLNEPKTNVMSNTNAPNKPSKTPKTEIDGPYIRDKTFDRSDETTTTRE